MLLSVDDHPRCFTTCPYAGTTIAYSHYFGQSIILAMTCKRWGCRYCGQRKSIALACRVQLAEPNKLITLTVNPAAYETPRDAYNHTRRKLSELSKVIRHEHGSFEYLRVLEVTKKGWPHYHLVARSGYIRQQWISDAWSSLTGAPIVDIRKIQKIEHVYQYVVKYLMKQTYIPWTNRRVSWSRHFFPPAEPTTKGKWQLTGKYFVDEHPTDVIRFEMQHQLCTKVAADAWIFPRPEMTSKDDKQASNNRWTPRKLPSLDLTGVYPYH